MRMGTPSVSLSQEDGELFGADDPTYTGKNVTAMFQNPFAEPPARKVRGIGMLRSMRHSRSLPLPI